MAYQNFQTDYTEVDPLNRLALATITITGTDVQTGETAYVYKDFGAGYFTGNFTHLLQIKITKRETYTSGTLWMLTNTVGNVYEIATNNFIKIGLIGAADTGLRLSETYNGSFYYDDWTPFTLNTDYYLTITRVGTVLTCKIYDDAGRTNLVKTLTINLQSAVAYRYVYGWCSAGVPGETTLISGYLKNLDLGNVAYTLTAQVGAFILTGKNVIITLIRNTWKNQAKNTAVMANTAKNASTATNQAKNVSTFTNTPKS